MKLNLIGISEFDEMKSIEEEHLEITKKKKSALFIVDMNNGFARKGALSSSRVEDIIPNIENIVEKFINNNHTVYAFTDSHNDNAIEFKEYPVHCVRGTEESELVEELKKFKNEIKIIEKNSTNGFLEHGVDEIINGLIENECKEFVVVGCCTDICVCNFAMTLKCYLNKENKPGKVIVPLEGVETFDAPYHSGDFMNMVALKIMAQNGITLVNKIL